MSHAAHWYSVVHFRNCGVCLMQLIGIVWYISETAVYISCRDLEFHLCANIYYAENIYCASMTVIPQYGTTLV
jgi:hypothetical protein